MKLTFQITVELKKHSGPRIEVEELEELIIQVVEDADPATLYGADGGEYDVLGWTCSEQREDNHKDEGRAQG